MDKLKNLIIVVALIFFILFIVIDGVSAGLFYTGDVVIKEENIKISVSYEGENAILDLQVAYKLKNKGNEQSIVYDHFAFGQIIEGKEITLAKNEEKTITFTTSRELKPPYSLNIDINLMINKKYIGNKVERGEFTITFSSKPTITRVNPKPTSSNDLEFKWIKENYVPVSGISLSWINKVINIDLEKEISPSSIKVGDSFTVVAKIKNNDEKTYHAKISDKYLAQFFTPVEEKEFIEIGGEGITLRWWVFEREFILGANEEKIFQYELKFLGCGVVDQMDLEGFEFSIPSEGFSKISDSAMLMTEICNFNHICEAERYENYLNCPEDCPSGSADGYCDKIKDGICDPDCAKGFDIDCIPLVCGDTTCDFRRGENYENCPQDCPSGSRDNYCDSIADGICDPDCKAREDIDCLEELCGNGKCDEGEGENYENCPQDCPKPVTCGDGSCDPGENYGNCPQDCPSGSLDNYCDGLEDGICDPDCDPEMDIDCKKNGVNYLPYIITIIVVIIVIFIIYMRVRIRE